MFVTDQTRQQAVFDRLRRGILAGALPAGSRLPPTRSLASELGVARQTVVLAYERLAAEGYVRARTGSGTFVAPDLPDAAPGPAVPAPTAASPLSRRGQQLAAVPASAAPRDAGVGTLLAGGLPAADLFPKELLDALCGPGSEIAFERPDRLPASAGARGAARPNCCSSRCNARSACRSGQHRDHGRHPAGAAYCCRTAIGPRRHRVGGGSRLHRRPWCVARCWRKAGAGSERYGGPGHRCRH